MKSHRGGCHCGKVQFSFQAPTSVTVQECNCSLCIMSGFQHLIIPASRFQLEQGGNDLSVYRFNSGVAKHLFCKHCGVKSFYVPRSNPDGYSINMRCVEQSSFEEIAYESFDGQNWEANAAALSHLSRE